MKNQGGQSLGSHLSRQERIELRKKEIGSQKERKLQKYSEGFNKIFNFFLKSNRCGILEFSGSRTIVKFDVSGDEGKYCFRKLENGQYKNDQGEIIPVTRHPNILKSVMIGKKSWGLFVNEWSKGISEGSFLKKEILEEFRSRKIEIPSSLLIDFENRIIKFTIERNKAIG